MNLFLLQQIWIIYNKVGGGWKDGFPAINAHEVLSREIEISHAYCFAMHSSMECEKIGAFEMLDSCAICMEMMERFFRAMPRFFPTNVHTKKSFILSEIQ